MVRIEKYINSQQWQNGQQFWSSLVTDITARSLILTIMDHFSDYQENRMVASVREASVKLFNELRNDESI